MAVTMRRAGGATSHERAIPSPTVTDPDFRTLYRRYYRLVWWVVRGAGVPEAWAEDVVHDVFLAVHRRLPELDDPARLRSWVIGIARNAAFSHRRGAARRSARQLVVPEPEAPTAVDSAVAYRQAWDQLRRFLDELDDEQREAFVLCELQGVAPAEVAVALQISRNTVYSRLRLARGKLVECFSERSPAQLPGLLQAARRQGQPTREQQQRTWAVLVAQLPLAPTGMAGPPAATPTTASTAGWVATGKAALVSMSLAAATLGVIGAVGHMGTRSATERPASASVGPAAASAPAPNGPAPNAPAPIAAPTPVTVSVTPSIPPPTLASTGASETEAVTQRRPPSPKASTSSPPGLDDVELLKQAALQLERGEPTAALTTLERHALVHPDSALSPERLGLRVRALCATGQVPQAEALAARHVAEHPDSPLAQKLASPCAGTGR